MLLTLLDQVDTTIRHCHSIAHLFFQIFIAMYDYMCASRMPFPTLGCTGL
jgi:hypothetical protein